MNQITRKYDERHYIGKSLTVNPKLNTHEIPLLWNHLQEHLKNVTECKILHNYIGLEEYPNDFMETHTFTYSAMVEIDKYVEIEGLYSRTLPKGTYISYEIEFDNIQSEIQKVYNHIKEKKLNIDYSFDFEDYMKEQDYSKKNQKMYFTFLLK
jgi:hypothetical protein